jgi:hypothetical protein
MIISAAKEPVATGFWLNSREAPQRRFGAFDG